jgi:hypothetical protein
LEKLEGTVRLGDIGVYGQIIFKLIFKEQGVRM